MAEPLPNLEVDDRFGCALPDGFIAGVVAATLRFAGREGMEVSLRITDEAGIASIHERFMGDADGTDVISFALDDGVDLVVSAERARRESAARGHAFTAELALYVVHGILHVCGYDDTTGEARSRMREAELEVLASLGLRVSPVDG